MKLLGALLFIVALINTLLLTFGFRDFSLQLMTMFLFTVLGLPLSTYLFLSSGPKDIPLRQMMMSVKLLGGFALSQNDSLNI